MQHELLAILKTASKYSQKGSIQNGLALHLHQQSLGMAKKPTNEIALKVMEIFVLWIQKEDE
jgi:hypothetical protein